MAIIVTATQGGITGNGLGLRVFVLTGAAAAQTGAAIASGSITSTTVTQSITTTQTGSRVYAASIRNENAEVSTAAAATTIVDDLQDGTNNARYVTFKATSLTGTPGPTTLGYTVTPTAATGGIALLEVLTAGSLTEDASGPAFASTLSAITIQTASFSPPPGALLVALVSSDGGAGVTTMSVTTPGVNWTEAIRFNVTSEGYAGVWLATAPASGSALPWQFDPHAGPTSRGAPSRTPWTLEPYPAELEAPSGDAGTVVTPVGVAHAPVTGGVTAQRSAASRRNVVLWSGWQTSFAFYPPTYPATYQTQTITISGGYNWSGLSVSLSVLPVAVVAASPLIAVYRRSPRQVSRAVIGNKGAVSGGVIGAARPFVVPPLLRVPIPRKYPPRVLFRGLAVAPRQPSLLPRPPPSAVAARPQSRRSRGFWAGVTVPTVNGPAVCALLVNGADSQSSGTTITAGNSAPPNNAFDAVNTTNSGTATYDNTHTAHGAEAFSFSTGGTGGQAYVAWSTSLGFPAQFWFRLYIYATVNNSNTYRIFAVFPTAANSLFSLIVSTTGTLHFLDHAGVIVPLTNGGTDSVTSIVQSPNQWFRVEGSVILSPTNGQATVSIYSNIDSQTPTETISAIGGVNFGSPISGTLYRFGMAVGSASITQFWLDDLAISSCGPIGPVGTPPQPSLSQQLIRRRTSARGFWLGTVSRTVNATVTTVNGSIQPQPTSRLPRRTSQRAILGNAIQSADGNAGTTPAYVHATGTGLVRRRTSSRGIWGGLVGPPRQIPVTGGLVRRRTSARGIWGGKAVPGRYGSPIVGGLIKRRTSARGIWGGLIGPPRQIPVTGGLVRRRVSVRGLWHGNAVPGILPISARGSLIRRRVSARAFWVGTVVRTVNAPPAFGPPGNQPGSGLVKRRAATQAQPIALWSGWSAAFAYYTATYPFVYQTQKITISAGRSWSGISLQLSAIPSSGNQPGGLIKRRTSQRSYIQFTPVRTVNQVPLNGSLQPRPTVPLPRRTAARGIWGGIPVPSRRSAPIVGGLIKRRTATRGIWGGQVVPGTRLVSVTGGLIKRRTSQRAFWLGIVVRTVNATPQFGPPGSQPGSGLVKRRTSVRSYVQFTPVRTVNQLQPTPYLQPRPTIPVPRRTAARASWRGIAVPGARSQPVTGSGLVKRRASARGIWGGLTGPPRQIPVTGGLIKRRTAARGIWGGKAVSGIQPVPVNGTGLVKRRTSARSFIQFTPVRTVNTAPQFGPPGSQPGSGLVKRRTSQRAYLQFTPVRTVNQFIPSGSTQPRPTISVPRRTAARGIQGGGFASPGTRSRPVTGSGLVKRRSTSRGIWGGVVGPPRQIPVTGGVIKRRTSARALWAGKAVPGILPVPVTGTGLVKRRTAARAFVKFTPVQTVNVTPQFGPPGNQPGSGLVKRRTTSRAFIQFNPVRTVNAIQPLNGTTGGLVKRRTIAPAVWRGNAVPGRQSVPAVGTGLVKRRTAAAGLWHGTVVRTKNQIPGLGTVPPHLVIVRRTAAAAVWHGNAVPGRRSAPVTGGLIKRRTAALAVWRGNTAPFRSGKPITGGLVKRRTSARGQNLHTIVRTINALPINGSQPGGTVQRRDRRQISGAFIKFKPVISNVPTILPQVLILYLGAPRVRWVPGYAPGRWLIASPRSSTN